MHTMPESSKEEVDPKYKILAERVELFRGLTPSDVRKIFAKGMTVRVAKGDTIFYKGTTGSQMYVLLAGEVGVFDGPKKLATLTTGHTFGEMSLLNQEPRSATIVALTDSNVFILSEDVFQKLLTKRVAIQILLNIARTMSQRISDSNQLIRELEER